MNTIKDEEAHKYLINLPLPEDFLSKDYLGRGTYLLDALTKETFSAFMGIPDNKEIHCDCNRMPYLFPLVMLYSQYGYHCMGNVHDFYGFCPAMVMVQYVQSSSREACKAFIRNLLEMLKASPVFKEVSCAEFLEIGYSDTDSSIRFLELPDRINFSTGVSLRFSKSQTAPLLSLKPMMICSLDGSLPERIPMESYMGGDYWNIILVNDTSL